MILYYVHDPMCSWCWGFQPTWEEIRRNLPKYITVKYLLGGLAPDSDEPMPAQMQQDLAGYWHKIQTYIPGTQFNFDFWNQCKPRRSTYPACRAVIAARQQDPQKEQAMIAGIQHAYYLKAQNPSDNATLIAIAEALELDKDQFSHDLNAPQTQKELEQEILFARQIGVQGFPSLILETKQNEYKNVPFDYNSPEKTLQFI